MKNRIISCTQGLFGSQSLLYSVYVFSQKVPLYIPTSSGSLKLHSCHYPHLLAMNSSGKKRMFEFNIPTGFRNKALGCGTPLPWVGNYPQFPFTPTGLRYIGANTVLENRHNFVGVEKREEETSLTQGSGVPQPLGYDMESRWDSDYIRRHLNTPS